VVGAIRPPLWNDYRLASSCVKLVSVAEVCSQPWTDYEAMFRIDSQVSPVEHGVHVRTEQQAVVETVFTMLGNRPDMRRLEGRANPAARDRATSVVRLEHDGLERALSESPRSKARITVHRTRTMPWLREIDLDAIPEQPKDKFLEVARLRVNGQVVSFALHDVRREVRWRASLLIGCEEPRVSHEDTSDDRVLAYGDRPLTVLADLRTHLFQTLDTIRLTEQLPRLRHRELREAAVEATTYDAVVRLVRLEEKRLAGRENPELSRASRTPEVDLFQIRTSSKKPVPIAVRDPHIRLHLW
jgi:hypothetical protein